MKTKDITDIEIEDAKKVLENFVVNPVTRDSAIESGIFAIANQSSMWETPSKIVYALREASHPRDPNARLKYSTWDVYHNEGKVNEIARQNGWRFHHERRFEDLIKRFANHSKEFWEDIILADSDSRLKLFKDERTRINYMNYKTFSFWHLCLGGTNLLPIDIHIARQLARVYGFDIDESFYTSVKRKPRNISLSQEIQLDLFQEGKRTYKTKRQNVARTLSPRKYLEIESKAIQYFSQDERFLKDGKLNAALVASVLWWRGANRGERDQSCIFGQGSSWILPYGNLREHN
jgi:hypothetical protein